MENCGGNMVYSIRSASGVERIRIGQERHAATLLHPIYNLPDENRAYVPVISPLTKMEFDSGPVAAGNNIRKPCAVKEPQDFCRCALLIGKRTQIRKKDRTFNKYLPLVKMRIFTG